MARGKNKMFLSQKVVVCYPNGKTVMGFTILELIIVIVIIGILAALSLASFEGPKEQAMDREAQINLKLISSAEKIYRMEEIYGRYINCTDTNETNINLRLMIPANDPNWKYKVKDASSSHFEAMAQRNSGSGKGIRIFCINETLDNATSVGCTW